MHGAPPQETPKAATAEDSEENDRVPSFRQMYTPQLAVFDIGSKALYNLLRNLIDSGDYRKNLSLLSSYDNDKNKFAAALILHFSRMGGELSCTHFSLKCIPRLMVPDVCMRIRIYIAYPFDEKNKYDLWCDSLNRAGMLGLIVQTVIATAVSNFVEGRTNDLRNYAPYLDNYWCTNVAEVPVEERTMSSGESVSMLVPALNEFSPSVAFLKLDKTAVELAHERHLARYIRKRLDLLGQLDPNRLLHLVFLPVKHDSSNGKFAEKDSIETVLDVSAIRSSVFNLVPNNITDLHKVLSDTDIPDFLPPDYCWRIYERAGDRYKIRHTKGGLVASFVGAVVHEVGHLLKIPHTREGIMRDGGINIQTFFLPDKVMNLGVTEKDIPQLEHLQGIEAEFEAELTKDFILKQVMNGQFDLTSLLLMSIHPLITHAPRAKMLPIDYDEDTGVVNADAGIRYVLYYTDDDDSLMYSFVQKNSQKQMVLKTQGKPSARALIVSSEGNFMLVVVKNKRRA